MQTYQIVPTDHVFEIPSEVAICPYCKAKLYASCEAWTEETEELWIAEEISVECDSEPDMEKNPIAWNEFEAYHSDMPYVYQLPVNDTIQKWINANFRFSK